MCHEIQSGVGHPCAIALVSVQGKLGHLSSPIASVHAR